MKGSRPRTETADLASTLFERMKSIHPGVADLELDEFQYGLKNLFPKQADWMSVELEERAVIEERVNSLDFYEGIQIKPLHQGKIILDPQITHLTRRLMAGLAAGDYPVEWIRRHFYFDLRGFIFLHRTVYYTPAVLAHLGGQPLRTFERRQKQLERLPAVGYKDFKKANAEVDELFMECVRRLLAGRGAPMLLAVAGATAAGKTEIVERLRQALAGEGHSITTIEMDNFLTDRDLREKRNIHSFGRAAIHLPLFLQSLQDILQGRPISIPRYDFISGDSSHDLQGNLKPGARPVVIEPAEVIFMEGNFPFLIEEVAPLIGVKVVYLTDDPVRMQRKWRRDIDLRKKYDPAYFCNRFFKDQMLMAERVYIPQLERCDLVVDTSGAALWGTPSVAEELSLGQR
jgi:uridine kinase